MINFDTKILGILKYWPELIQRISLYYFAY